MTPLRQDSYTHAGGVVYRKTGSAPQFLLVRARSDAHEWVFPKGHIEAGETPEQAAIREVAEEAGVNAEIVSALGVIDLPAGRSQMFLMRYTGPATGQAERECAWLPAEDAMRSVAYAESRRLISAATEALESRR